MNQVDKSFYIYILILISSHFSYASHRSQPVLNNVSSSTSKTSLHHQTAPEKKSQNNIKTQNNKQPKITFDEKKQPIFQKDDELSSLCKNFIDSIKDFPEDQKSRTELRNKIGTEKYKQKINKAFDAYKKMFDYTLQHKKSAVDKEVYKQVKHATKKLFESKNIKNMVLRLHTTQAFQPHTEKQSRTQEQKK